MARSFAGLLYTENLKHPPSTTALSPEYMPIKYSSKDHLSAVSTVVPQQNNLPKKAEFFEIYDLTRLDL